ncbi:monocarboxylate transporter 12-B [Takifugu rubripes]|nr:monocarboxylate transporter 12-B [Takifugu rubripes]XP_011613798.1 monocarboxylate transporter 12-B [Takifugu rubripes]|eukprot:XP_011613753.1 PREDICTED: monocarboxylate transporter 12 [Takifugu rubripes]
MVGMKQPQARTSHLDGGWGWVIVGCCFMVTVCTRAVTRCISIFFVEFQSHFEADYSATAWVHSLADCTTMLCAPFGSLIVNRWSGRVSVMLGGLLSSCGLLLSSFSNSLEFLYFSMGIMMGLGFALCYTPAIVMVGCYFRERTALAYGVGLSGSGIGTFVLAPLVQSLIDLYSWRGALLVLSAFVANLCVCGALLRPIAVLDFKEEEETAEEKMTGHMSSQDVDLALKPPKEAEVSLLCLPESRRWCLDSCTLSSKDYSFLLLPDFLGLAVSFLLLSSGCSLPFIYLVPYALDNGLSQHNAAFLMSILGVINIVGNVTFGWLTDRKCLKPYRLTCYIVSVMMEGLCCLFVPLLRSFLLLVPFAVLYGYFDGAYVALIPVVTSDLVGTRHLSSALGVVYFLHGIPYLISPPTGGWLVDITGSYTATFFLSGCAILASALTLAIIAGILHCRHVRVAKEAQHRPLH